MEAQGYLVAQALEQLMINLAVLDVDVRPEALLISVRDHEALSAYIYTLVSGEPWDEVTYTQTFGGYRIGIIPDDNELDEYDDEGPEYA